MISRIKGMLRRKGLIGQKGLDGFLRNVSGVIHVGANTGQERKLYAQYRLRVAWIEPISEFFEVLKANLATFPDQHALQCLITDKDDREYPFHIASNAGGSSSILDLYLHKDVWPEVTYTRTITIKSMTLVTLLKNEHIDPSDFDALVMDTQGSELLVLKGAIPLLKNFKYIKTEVADFEAYKDCCQLADIEAFLRQYGYRESSRMAGGQHPQGGSYYDIVYKKESLPTDSVSGEIAEN